MPGRHPWGSHVPAPAIALAIALAGPADAFAQKRAFTIEDLYRVTGIGGFAVSPDERSVVYAVSTTDLPRAKRTSKLWMIGADGANARQITLGTGNESDALFSPDGQWLSFVSTRDGSGQLYVMPTTGGEARKVTSISTGVSTPAWTPDSKAMAFATDVYPECNADDACNKKIAERWKVVRSRRTWPTNCCIGTGPTGATARARTSCASRWPLARYVTSRRATTTRRRSRWVGRRRSRSRPTAASLSSSRSASRIRPCRPTMTCSGSRSRSSRPMRET